VTDESGKPVPKAAVSVGFGRPNSFANPWAGTHDITFRGKTSRNGRYSASSWTTHLGYVQVSKKGYYPWQKMLNFAWDRQGYRPTVAVTLRKVHKPIPMYAKRLDDVELPVLNEPVGYDLMKGDWVKPHGVGEHSDLVFLGVRDERDYRDFSISLKISVLEARGGFRPVPKSDVHENCALKLPREAPEKGYSIREFVYKWIIGPDQPGKRTASTDTENFFFRVRTVLDDEGRITHAQYGKLAGPIDYHRMKGETLTVKFTYYLNPTPNDRNVEFDVRRNLLKHLKSLEKVDRP
jgi:hypothetical protein